MSSLDSIEIKKILEKLRSEYSTFSKENPTIFKSLPFEERYTQVLKAKGNIENFLKDEIVFFEKLKEKHNELQAKKEALKGDTLNRILDEIEERLQKYPRIEFHPLAKKEMKYFYGAIMDFVNSEVPALYAIFRGTPEMNLFSDTLSNIERFGYSRKGLPSVGINEHIKSLLDANGNNTKIEKDTQTILKDISLNLKSLTTNLKDSIEKKRISPNYVLQINEKDYPNSFQNFQGKTALAAVDMILAKIKGIIVDFRMDAIVGLK
ncbi:MAG: hypothetical protein L6Q54_08020 [Leptospiraceae bacterium]|nr:hypothetical protein [Leptospiraceae bacterium]MCK6381181.1 hypothetical protein [Leptospiraceae bacterium]NUM40463.1 hypothetical protein [Leptospiraceae bacterium]